MTLEIDSSFLQASSEVGPGNFENQYNGIYNKRLEQLSPLIEPLIPQPYCTINSIIQGKNCSLIGVTYKELFSRPNILNEYKELTGNPNPQKLEATEKDKL